MDRTLDLPSRKNFYSSIQEKSISKEDYKFAKSVWRKFNIKNLTEYAELYCSIDTLLLAEIFQKFRKTMMKFSGLDPSYYISLPGLGWDTMLKTTGCCIGLPVDIDQIQFIERGIRGGFSFINTRYKSTKNLTGNARIDNDTPDPSIRYIDANVSIVKFENEKFKKLIL